MKRLILPAVFGLTILYLSSFVLAGVTSVDQVTATVGGERGKWWFIDWSSEKRADYIETYDSRKLERETGSKSERAFTLKITSTHQEAHYGSDYKRRIVKVELKEIHGGWPNYISDEEKEDFIYGSPPCLDLDKDGYPHYVEETDGLGGRTGLYCFKFAEKLGTARTIYHEVDAFSVDWKINPAGKEAATTTITNENPKGNLSEWILKDKVFVQWKGSFDTGVDHPQADSVHGDLLMKSVTGERYINREQSREWSDYEDAIADDGMKYVQKYATGEMSKSDAEWEVNNPASRLFSWDTEGKWDRDLVEFKDNEIVHNLANKVVIPDFDVWIDGDYYVEVIVPAAEPEVKSVKVPRLKGSGRGSVTVNVRNKADTAGELDVSLECGKGVSVVTPPQSQRFKPHETRPFSFRITTPSITRKTRFPCEATAFDPIKERSDSKTGYGTMVPRKTCYKGEQEKRRENGKWCIYECNPDTGRINKFVKCCKKGEDATRVDATFKCVSRCTPGKQFPRGRKIYEYTNEKCDTKWVQTCEKGEEPVLVPGSAPDKYKCKKKKPGPKIPKIPWWLIATIVGVAGMLGASVAIRKMR